jgi:hypothetical protein
MSPRQDFGSTAVTARQCEFTERLPAAEPVCIRLP